MLFLLHTKPFDQCQASEEWLEFLRGFQYQRRRGIDTTRPERAQETIALGIFVGDCLSNGSVDATLSCTVRSQKKSCPGYIAYMKKEKKPEPFGPEFPSEAGLERERAPNRRDCHYRTDSCFDQRAPPAHPLPEVLSAHINLMADGSNRAIFCRSSAASVLGQKSFSCGNRERIPVNSHAVA